MNIFLDIETIPDQRPGALDAFLADARENFRAPSTLTKEQAAKDLGMTDASEIKFTPKDAMISKWEAEFSSTKAVEVAEQAWRKTSFDGGAGCIAVASIAIDDDPPIRFFSDSWQSNEQLILMDLFETLSQSYDPSVMTRPCFIGHNHIAFDLPFIWKRAIILGIRPPSFLPRSPRPWDSDIVFDTMTQWAGTGNRISMDALCSALGIPGKDGMDGSQVWDYVRDGKIAEVAEYCAADVERTRAIYKRLTFQA